MKLLKPHGNSTWKFLIVILLGILGIFYYYSESAANKCVEQLSVIGNVEIEESFSGISDRVLWQHVGDDDSISVAVSDNDTKYILLYSTFWGDARWELQNDTVYPNFFRSIDCPATACIVTNQRDFLNSVEDFDALLFHPIDAFVVPPRRRSSQIYVALNLESPLTYPEFANAEGYTYNFYNWFSSYRMDADVPYYSGRVLDAVTREFVAPSQNPKWRTIDADYYNKTELEMVGKRRKFAAWIVSNCNSYSFRRSLVNSLREHVAVDIFGKCSDRPEFVDKCPKTNAALHSCDAFLTGDYKFVLGLENSLCEDYVTEKLFYYLQLPIVPVVYGGGNYSKFAPPHSYIDANDYETPGDLARYLTYLAENPREYIKYFWWKRHYDIREVRFVDSFCGVCTKLHQQSEPHLYFDLESWRRDRGGCTNTPRIKFPLIADGDAV